MRPKLSLDPINSRKVHPIGRRVPSAKWLNYEVCELKINL